jgi:hypothetical protein
VGTACGCSWQGGMAASASLNELAGRIVKVTQFPQLTAPMLRA